MLEYTKKRYLQEAENLVLEAFSILQMKFSNLKDDEIEKIYNRFVNEVSERNPLLLKGMRDNEMEFDFDSIIIKRYLQPLKNAKNTLVKLNEILN
jgi:uncharacterized protein YggL (DUF469 family)